MKYLSPSLLDSFAYYISVRDDEQKEIKRKEIIDRLNGVKTPSTPAQIEGLNFEGAVYEACVLGKYKDKNQRYADCVNEIADIVRGGAYQHAINIEVNGVRFFSLPDKPIAIDFINVNTAYDVKTTSKYEVGKYQFYNQHLVYLLALRNEQIDNFMYLITDFKNVYKEFYQWKPSFGATLKSNMAEFFNYLTADNEMNTAYQNYCTKKDKEFQDIALVSK